MSVHKKVRTCEWVLIILCLLALVLNLCDCFCNFNWNDLLQVWILSITAITALEVYKSNTEIEEVNTCIKIREMLTSDKNMQIHQYLENVRNQKEKNLDIDEKEPIVPINGVSDCDVYNYLGILELTKIILDHNIIDEKSYINQFGYRIENIVYCKRLVYKIDNDKKYWEDLLGLIDRFYDYEKQYNTTLNS